MNEAEARNFSRRLNLPPLVGSPDEIQQAEQIRAEKLEQFPFFKREPEMFYSELEARYLPDNCLQQLQQSNEANFWIENRDLDFWELLAWF